MLGGHSANHAKPLSDASTSAAVNATPSTSPLPDKPVNGTSTAVAAKKKPGDMYVPDFTKAVQHFCIHAGGRAVIDAIQSALRLNDEYVKASRETLRRWGNTSSSSIWYELHYLEQEKKVQSGEKVLQLGFGSGFKCNTMVLKKL